MQSVSSRLSILLRLVLTLGLVSLPALGQEPIRWRSGPASLAAGGPRDVPSALRTLAARPDRHVVVQLGGPTVDAARAELARLGLTLLTPLGGGSHAWFAALDPAVLDAPALARTNRILALQPVQSAWKLHPDLAAGALPDHAIVAGKHGADPRIAAYAVFHADVALADAVALSGLLGARVVDALESINALVLELPLSRLPALVAADELQWLEPPLPRLDEVNDQNRVLTEANIVQAAPYGLNGSGVTVLVYDAGTGRSTHLDFGGRLTVRDASGLIAHATHVAATIGGSGAASGGTFRGMAPAVTIQSYGFQYDGTGTFLYTNPGDIESDYDDALNLFSADVANNSIGTNTETNGFSCNIQGDYGVCSSLIDAVVHGSLGAPFPVVWANGNERQGSRCDLEGFGDYYSTAPPATAKNHITVGALNANDDSMTTFSSWGPTDDGRIKPDISAPGCQSNLDGGVTSASSSSDTAYTTMCGTSMASPTVAGLCALLIQDHRTQFGGPDPRSSTLKVLLAQTAFDRGNAGPDYQFGYGSVRIQQAVDFLRTGRFREDSVAGSEESFVYTVQVDPGDPELKLTLAWDDVPGVPNIADALVNDLDLRVFDPSDVQRFPFVLNPAAPAAVASTGVDHANNIEQVRVVSPASGTWRVEVFGFDVPSGPQPFSLASSHDLDVGPFLAIGLVTALPERLEPGTGTTLTASVRAVNDTLVAGSPTLFVSYDAGPFLALPMTSLGGDLYEADLPPPVCGAQPAFYLQAQGLASGVVRTPADAPAIVFTLPVEELTTHFADDFDANLGWTVQNVALTDGAFERGVPAGSGGRNDPPVDFDGSGACFLTDNVEGNSDIDGGPTRILSPVLDLSAVPDPLISYARWFGNDDLDVDRLLVEVSNDGGTSWVPVESVANTNGWASTSFALFDFLAPTATVRLRFSATDNPNDSVTEAAVDDVRVVSKDCASALPDCNGNGILDADDIASGRSDDANFNGVPDECEGPNIFANRPRVQRP